MKVGVIDGEEFISHALIPIPDLRASMSAQTTASLLGARLYPGVNFESRTNTERAGKPRATVSIQKSFGIGFEFVAAFAGDERVRTWRWRTLAALLRTIDGRSASLAICYAADPGNTASIFVFSVAALNGLTM